MTEAHQQGAGAAAGVDDPDRADLVYAWAKAADQVDELDLAATLIAHAGHPATATATRRAGLAYLSGDAALVLTILAEIGASEVPSDGPRSMNHVLVLGAQAIEGDQAAFATLVGLGALLPVDHRPWYLYILGVAAERTGQRAVAADAWRALFVDHGVRTTYVVGRFASSWIATRNRVVDPIERVAQAAHAVRSATPRPWHDTYALERAVEALEASDDRAGAMLLVGAVARTSPRSAQLDDLSRRTRPVVRTAPALLPWVGATVLTLLLGLVGLAAGVLGIALLRGRWRVVPDLSPTDERTWFALDRLPLDDEQRRLQSADSQFKGLAVLFALLGLVLGAVAAAGIAAVVADAWPGAPLVLVAGWWLAPVLALPLLGVKLGRRLIRLSDARVLRRREADADRARLVDTAACGCWERSVHVGPYAVAYAAHHLRPAAPVVSATWRPVVLECPLSGLRWLSTASASGVSMLLLRGTPPQAIAEPEPLPVGTGGYL